MNEIVPAGRAPLTIASPEVAANKPLSELVDATLAACSKSSHTRRSYTTGIGMFLQFMAGEHSDKIPSEWLPLATSYSDQKKTVWGFSQCPSMVLRIVDSYLIDNYAGYRESHGDSPNTVVGRVAAARTLLSVALRDRVLTFEQAQMLGVQPYKTRLKRDDEPTGRRLTQAEVRAYRASIDISTKMGKRDLATIDAMLFAGLRRSEVAALRFSNFRRDAGRLWIRVTGKGKKTRSIKVHDTLYATLSKWFECVDLKWNESDRNTPVLFAFDRGDHITTRPIDTNVIDRVVSSAGARTKVIDHAGAIVQLAPATGQDRLSAHDLRRTCARNSYDNGATLIQVQLMLGHEDPKTTARYIGLDQPTDNTAVDYLRY